MLENTFASYATVSDMEVLELHQVTVEFRQEIAYRQALEAHCQWYDKAAQAHRDELERMQQDIPILNWFLSFRR